MFARDSWEIRRRSFVLSGQRLNNCERRQPNTIGVARLYSGGPSKVSRLQMERWP